MIKDRNAVIERYAELCVEDMDLKPLCIFAIDLEEQIAENVRECPDEEVIELITEIYPQVWEEFPQD